MGDGGGSGSSRGEDSSSDGDVGDAGSMSPVFKADLELLPDLTDAASVRSAVSPVLKFDVELRGLSVLLPGIFDLSPRKDLVDSLVSALLNDGYDCRFSAPLSNEVLDRLPRGVLVPEPFELWFPIFVFNCRKDVPSGADSTPTSDLCIPILVPEMDLGRDSSEIAAARKEV